MWVSSKLSDAAGALGAESIELRNWLIRFGCVLEDFRVVAADLAGLMANSSPPWSAYLDMMACCLIALDKRPGVLPVGIGETLRQAIDKLVMRAAGDQAKTECGSIQLYADLKAGIEGAAHDVSQKRRERSGVGWTRAEQREETGYTRGQK